MANPYFPQIVDRWATNGDDTLRTGFNELTFGLNGNDMLIANVNTEANIMVGGAGDDTYVVSNNSAVIISDSSGYDTLVAMGIGFGRASSYVAIVDGKHLLARDTVSNQQVTVANWTSPSAQIERIELSSGTYSFLEIVTALNKDGSQVDNITSEQLAQWGALPAGTTAAVVEGFVNYVTVREAELVRTMSAAAEPKPPSTPHIYLVDVDDAFYLSHNPDVARAGVNPDLHFSTSGWHEGRNPNGWFDTSWYMQQNADVAAAKINPFSHFEQNGWREGRDPNAMFDTSWYLHQYVDVQAAGVNPAQHYWDSGWKEGRDPSATFQTNSYLAANPDVALAGVNPLEHWMTNGQPEGRLLA
ncbi:hypothetical protein EKL30_09855 [Candidimonas sp. SYP-B2681]|uniref:hypothetical protein n=1 Tax=Candidimonas sp. SYP-B2681 TaxID=2497686 RepID=UPI000F87AB04|nr:hypothetical protein [Candidimonas sp. SYP-B2681]RTZ43180.1 hypothetical protein EKL30_09855 [Candidimonas sp. SYP-B2681]